MIPKIAIFEGSYLFQTIILGIHVRFLGCNIKAYLIHLDTISLCYSHVCTSGRLMLNRSLGVIVCLFTRCACLRPHARLQCLKQIYLAPMHNKCFQRVHHRFHKPCNQGVFFDTIVTLTMILHDVKDACTPCFSRCLPLYLYVHLYNIYIRKKKIELPQRQFWPFATPGIFNMEPKVFFLSVVNTRCKICHQSSFSAPTATNRAQHSIGDIGVTRLYVRPVCGRSPDEWEDVG